MNECSLSLVNDSGLGAFTTIDSAEAFIELIEMVLPNGAMITGRIDEECVGSVIWTLYRQHGDQQFLIGAGQDTSADSARATVRLAIEIIRASACGGH